MKETIKIDRSSPIKATERNFNSPKTWIFFGLTLLAYGLMFLTLFGKYFVLESMIYVMLFFVFFHFLYLEIRKLPVKYFLLFMLGVTVLQGLFIGYSHVLLVLSMLTINLGIVYFARFLQGESHDKVKFSSRGYFNVGGYIFTVFITIGYSLFILGYYEKFPFTCQDLSNASNRVIDFFTRPVTEGVHKIKTDTSGIFTTKIKDITTIGQDISLQTKQSSYSTIIQKINTYKKNLIDQALTDNSTVNMGICDFILAEMNKIYNNPAFKVSVILLMFLLLYGFIRIVFRVMTGLAFIIFKILFKLDVYRIKIVLKEVEDLE